MTQPTTYTEDYIRDKLDKSDIWLVAGFKRIAKDQKAANASDKNLFNSLETYFAQFNNLNDKHIQLLRRRLKDQPYLGFLTRVANGA